MQHIDLSVAPVRLYHHKTFEIVDIIDDVCDLVVTMNVTYSLAKRICSPDVTVMYLCSCSRDPAPLCLSRQFIATCHMKLYRTSRFVYVSTSNLSLSNWDEVTVCFPRCDVLDAFISNVIRTLRIKSSLYTRFF